MNGAGTISEQEIDAVNNNANFNNRQYTITGLTNGSRYRFTVQSRNAAGLSAAGSTDCYACVTPNQPTNLRIDNSQRTISSLGIMWDAGVNNQATGVSYTVSYSYQDDNGLTRTQTASGLVTNSFALNTGIVLGRSYSFTVYASNVCGQSVASPSLTLVAGTIPGSAANVRSQFSGQNIQCAWDAAIANGFQISSYIISVRSNGNVYQNAAPYCSENAQRNAVRNFNDPALSNVLGDV